MGTLNPVSSNMLVEIIMRNTGTHMSYVDTVSQQGFNVYIHLKLQTILQENLEEEENGNALKPSGRGNGIISFGPKNRLKSALKFITL